MATTFDSPVTVTEVAEGRFRLFRGGDLPVDVSASGTDEPEQPLPDFGTVGRLLPPFAS